MKIFNLAKLATTFAVSVMMSHIPNVALAEVISHGTSEMIATSVVLDDIQRADAQKEIQQYVSKAEVQAQLASHGLSAAEINSRLASLSESEINQLSGQVKEAKAGGDILVAVLLVVLIIYFAKRI